MFSYKGWKDPLQTPLGACDAARREAWLQKKDERQQEVPAENDIDFTETLESGENVNSASEVTLESSEANT